MTISVDELISSSPWKWIPLKRLTRTLRRGTTPNYSDTGTVRVLGQMANQDAGINWQKTRLHEGSTSPRDLKGYLEQRDVLVNSTGTGTLGRVGYFSRPEDDLPCIADSHVTIVRANKDVLHPRFAYYCLKSSFLQHQMMSTMVVGSTNQIELSPERLASTAIPVPSIDEQRRIADFLDAEAARVDKLLSLRNAQQRTVSEWKASRVHALFSETDGLRLTKLKHLLRQSPCYGVLVPEFVDSGVPLIRINDLLDLDNRLKSIRQIPRPLSKQYRRTELIGGEILVSVVGTLGRATVAPASAAGANVNRAIAVLRPRDDVDRNLLAGWINSYDFQIRALKATASDSAQRTLGMEDLGNFSLSWAADTSSQRNMTNEFTHLTEAGNSVAARIRETVSLIEERKRSLITAAVMGQFDAATVTRSPFRLNESFDILVT